EPGRRLRGAEADDLTRFADNLAVAERGCSELEPVAGVAATGQGAIQLDPDVAGWRLISPLHVIDPATLAQRQLERTPERVAYEPQRVEKVALAGAVRADEEDQRAEAHVAEGDALVVAQHDAGDDGPVRH